MRHVLTISVLVLSVAGCGAGETRAPASSAPPEQAGAASEISARPLPVRTMEMWAGSCALCHVDGNAMAPRVGHAEEWAPRLAKGKDVLLRHTLQGVNDMPPLGYCMACETEDFVAMIDFMTAGLEPAAATETEAGGG